MTGLLEACEQHFGSCNLYEVLGISKDASDSELKKAYHRLSLSVHPDRVSKKEKKNATEKFQVLGKVYAILCDKEHRAVYDETGEIDEESYIPPNRNWEEYWRLLFKKVTLHDIKKFEAEYIGSESELADLKAAYIEGEGDMQHIIDSVLCATSDDEERFRELLNSLIKKKEVPKFSAFVNDTDKQKQKRKRKAQAEAKEAERLKTEMGLDGSESSLRNTIMQRQQRREKEAESFLDDLAAKYAKTTIKKTKKTRKS